jgi:hypothetical protein
VVVLLCAVAALAAHVRKLEGAGGDRLPLGPPGPGAPGPGAVPYRAADAAPRFDGLPVEAARPGQPRRPFRHAQHERLSCLECHGARDRHRTVTVRTPRDCAACHHDPRRGYACASCHDADLLPEGAPHSTTMRLSVWQEARQRTLPFDHSTHAVLACRDCHTAPVTAAVQRSCASCHTEHHRAEAECVTCHVTPPPEAHPREAHLGCAGAGCHTPREVEVPLASRTLCLACHAEQRDHEPGGVCAACHMVTPHRLAPPPAARAAHPLPGGRP